MINKKISNNTAFWFGVVMGFMPGFVTAILIFVTPKLFV